MHVFADIAMVEVGLGEFEEVSLPLIRLDFDYEGRVIRGDDPAPHFFVAGAALRAEPRNRDAEIAARRVLEGLGAVELSCMPDLGIAPDVLADYVVTLADRNAGCAFSKHALPELRRQGFEVTVAEDYPFQVVFEEAKWYAVVEQDDEESSDWFELELGVEVEGHRLNLLPALLDMIDVATGNGGLTELESRGGRDIAVPISDTHSVMVPAERFGVVLRVLLELYDGRGSTGRLRFDIAEAIALMGLTEEMGDELDLRAPRRVRQRCARIGRSTSELSFHPPEGLQATLRSYQEEGVAWLLNLSEAGMGGVLADDMGLGKTLQTIAFIVSLRERGFSEHPTLVVAPTSLIGNWKRELEKFAPSLSVGIWHGSGRHRLRSSLTDHDVVLTSYPLLGRDFEFFETLEFGLVALDEAHTIKNPRSLAFRSANALNTELRLCLTGTPVENHLGELWSLFEFLNPGLLGDAMRFRDCFRTPIEKYGDDERLAALRQKVAPYMLRRLKSEVATELPPKTEIVTAVELRGKQRELYESIRVSAHSRVRTAIHKKGFEASRITILDALTKLRQVCCDPRLVRMDAARFVRESAKFERLFEILETALSGNHRVLIFSQFTSMLSLMANELNEREVPFLAITGATKHRQDLVDRFENGEADVFLLSLKAAGTGLNLVSADTVIHYDPWWNPTAQAQATDRAYRIGQDKPVMVYNVIAAGSVEERMLSLQAHKRRLADGVLGNGAAANSALSPDELNTLFAPLGRIQR